jgi:dynein heavy chain
LGGAPAGPAGTGKTESTKDLAKALAKYCIVFNCSDGMDHLLVQRYFKGLAATGSFCCFDEFNRINEEVLSVIAQYLLQLLTSKALMLHEIDFEGSHIKMKPTFCVFITMNPGYAGRKELPDNLVALFRPVAMMVPDYALIGEIMLYSFGFLQGRALAGKMVTTFTLASEQLSSQCHYDYGMRAVRSVINNAGILKNQFPDMDEQQLLMRALRDVNVPKFLVDDLPLFENIILDLFPGVDKPEQKYFGLIEAIHEVCEEMNLQCSEPFLTKVLQLYDTTVVRHGLMLVGPAGAGKTMNYKVLAKACSKLGDTENYEKVILDILNPKSITKDSMYGFVDPATQEWNDGVLPIIVMACCRDETVDKHWIMFDGPVDAVWIEDMNTVLDDNKKLCLNSGQIIQLTPHMTMMFEVADLLVASPATVSRCGMVYMEPESLTLWPLVISWLNTLPEKVKTNKFIKDTLTTLMQNNLADACYFVRKNLVEPVATMDNNIASSLMRLISCFMTPYVETEIKIIS